MTNDVHSNAVYEDATLEQNEYAKMGYAYLAGFVEKSKSELKDDGSLKYKDVDLVSAGDDISGGPGYGFMSKGEKIAELMGDVGYTATTAGNHEFDYGIDQFDKIVEMLNNKGCQTVSYNFANKAPDGTLTPHLLPYCTKTLKNGKKIAYIGISTPATITASNPKNFIDEYGNLLCSDTCQEVF